MWNYILMHFSVLKFLTFINLSSYQFLCCFDFAFSLKANALSEVNRHLWASCQRTWNGRKSKRAIKIPWIHGRKCKFHTEMLLTICLLSLFFWVSFFSLHFLNYSQLFMNMLLAFDLNDAFLLMYFRVLSKHLEFLRYKTCLPPSCFSISLLPPVPVCMH